MFSIKCLCSKKNLSIFFNNVCLPLKKLYQPLIRPLLKSSFSTNFQGTGLWEGPIRCSRLFPGGHTIAANFSRADPGAKRRTKSLLQKQPSLSVSIYISRSFAFPCYTFYLKKTWGAKGNAINMLNPTHYKYCKYCKCYQYYNFTGKKKDFNCRQYFFFLKCMIVFSLGNSF